ncbi:MAG TPA: hypothetical protein VGP72_00610 [Planctomycetota bacterium]|jgi:hypothetical protein
MAMAWSFRKMQKDEVNVDPIQSEFFNTEALPNLADALVREAIQNSLDAALPGTAVRLRISLSGLNGALPSAKTSEYLAGLWPHIEAPASGLADVPANDSPMPFLVLEDFGTRGLRGDPSQHDDGDAPSKNDFYYFWRNVGRSGKGETDRGRWGLGKNVFPASSQVNAFLGLTVRADDQQQMLMGQSVLKIHRINGVRHYPYGYFADVQDGLPMPSQNKGFLEQFSADFGLQRGDKPGLSIVIPFPSPDITPQLVVEAVVRHYFFPILTGSLIVTVSAPGAEELIFTADSTTALVKQRGGQLESEIGRLLDLARWATREAGPPAVLNEQPPQAAPKWSSALIPENLLKAIRQGLEQNQRIAVRVPIWVRLKNREPQQSFFDLFFERDYDLQHEKPVFIREGVQISGVRASRQRGIRALVTVSDKPLASMLGDAENPAHTDWVARSTKFKGKYAHGPECLRFIKEAVYELVSIISQSDSSVDDRALKDIFYLPKPTAEEPKTKVPKGGPGKDGSPVPPPTPPPPKPRPIAIEQIKGGFCLRAAKGGAPLPSSATVRVAYEMRKGNPFKAYQLPDFQLDKPPIKVASEKVTVSSQSANQLALTRLDPAFTVTVTGFDPRRDLRVQVVTEDGANARS